MDEAEDAEIARARLALSIFNLEMIFDLVSLSLASLSDRTTSALIRVGELNTGLLNFLTFSRLYFRHGKF